MEAVNEEVSLLKQSESVTILGDMNMDAKNYSNKGYLSEVSKNSLNSALPFETSTTDNNTNLDLCFTNYSNLTATVYETYYSLHKGLSLNWN